MKRILLVIGFFLAILGIWYWPPGSWMVSKLEVDGQFGDWQGRAFLSDAEDDGTAGQDFEKVCWGTNANQQKLYFMIERYLPAGEAPMNCRLFFDINGNGSYQDRIDKFLEISYKPGSGERGRVSVHLYSIEGNLLASYGGRWGEDGRDGGRRFEFGVPMKDLNVYPAQPLRFYLCGIGSAADCLPDNGDIQWAPFPVAVKDRLPIAVFCLFWLVITVMFYHHRIWIFYYIWAVVGCTFLLVLLLHGSLVEYKLGYQTALVLHYLFGYFDVITYVFDKAPGTLLVLIKVDNSWTTMDIDIESSGLLEACVLLALVLFYPAFSPGKRVLFSLGGVAAVYVINLFRLVLVIAAIHWGGRNMYFVAHTLLGRLFFFVFIVALYWQILTRPSLKKVREYLDNA